MTIELYISGQFIEEIPVNVSECKTYEHRKEKVDSLISWLKYQYRQSIEIKNDWEIILSAQSKMNEQEQTL